MTIKTNATADAQDRGPDEAARTATEQEVIESASVLLSAGEGQQPHYVRRYRPYRSWSWVAVAEAPTEAELTAMLS